MPGTGLPLLQQCLALTGHGEVASVVGTLREEVVGIDVDAAHGADVIVDTLRDWCTAPKRQLWHLVRPSGGAPGRAHVFIVPGRHREELTELIAALRRELGPRGRPLRPRDIDLRSQLRPLSGPHRHKPTPALDVEVLATALEGLREYLQPLPRRIAAARTLQQPSQQPARRTTSGADGPLVPLPRAHRRLPAPWAAYLRQGRPAAAASGLDRDPGTRSELELAATRQLVLAGYSEEQAWQAITAAHPTAFTKARSNGRRWWWHVWNSAVRSADDWLSSRRSQLTQRPAAHARQLAGAGTDEQARRAHIERAVRRAYEAMLQRWLAWPERVRHSAREVYTVALRRLARVGASEAPMPLRDFLLDCAVGSCNTVREARNHLITEGLLQVRSTYVAGTTDTADTWGLPPAFTDPSTDPAADGAATGDGVSRDRNRTGLDAYSAALSATDTSRGSPPQPALPLRLALKLPRTHLLSTLQAAREPLPPAVLAHQAGLLPADAGEHPTLSPRQQRTVRAYLQDLAELGLASVDAHGSWSATSHEQDHDNHSRHHPAEPANEIDAVVLARTELLQVGHERHQAVRATVEAERADFRARMDPDRRRQRWAAQREQVLTRHAQHDLARHRRWWTGLGAAEQGRRRADAAASFTALSPAAQAERKHALALRRARAGGGERERYITWWNGMSEQQRDTCRSQRTLLWRRHDPETQRQLVAAWCEHRARWGLPQRPRGSHHFTETTTAALFGRDLVLDLTSTGEQKASTSARPAALAR